jgi:hypothetical protein
MFLIVISGGDASYYWGITFLALVMAFTPVIGARFAPSRQLDSTR